MKETIFVAIPVLEEFKAHTVDCLMRLRDYWAMNPVFNFKYSIIIGSRQIHFARNALVRAGLAQGADYICFLDADMMFPADTVHQLYYASKDIVGVIYPGRIKPHPPNVFFWDKDKTRVEQVGADWLIPKSPLAEVDAVGTGVMLIRKRVFEGLEKPYFYYEENRSEDIMFCEKARRAGFKIHINTKLKVGHIGDEVFYYEKK